MDEINGGRNSSNESQVKAVALISGGLDSVLAAKIIKDQGVQVYGLNFHSPFCTCNANVPENACAARFMAEKAGIPLKIVSNGDDYLALIKNPRFGYGKHLNPCIDCRIYTLKRAKAYMDEIGARFIITGEVLGQRPMSQNIKALKIIEKESGLEGLIVRSLSAKYFPPTLAEKEGIIDRKLLSNIKGRSRKRQIELGKKWNIIEQYCAGGGCRLTEEHFARKVKDYLVHTQKPTMKDIKFLMIGRHFRVDGVKIIVGRNHTENIRLKHWARKDDVLVWPKHIKGPITLIERPKSKDHVIKAAELTLRYSDTAENSATFNVMGDIIPEKEISVSVDLDILNGMIEKWRV